MSTKGDWEAIGAARRKALLDSIPAEWRIPTALLPPESQADVTGFPQASGWFTAKELEITGSTAAQLLPRLASGALSSEEVTKAFCKRAAAAHQLVGFPERIAEGTPLTIYRPTACRRRSSRPRWRRPGRGTSIWPARGSRSAHCMACPSP